MPPMMPPPSKKESDLERTLQKWLLGSQIFAAIAIPIVLAVVGFFVQKAIQGETIKRDYVNLAVTLLAPQKKDDPEKSKELRKWAIRLLNDSSPVKLTTPESEALLNEGLPKFSFGTRNWKSAEELWLNPEAWKETWQDEFQKEYQKELQKKLEENTHQEKYK